MHRLLLDREVGGYRYYLNNRGVHVGDFIEIKRKGEWICGRYEWNYNSKHLPVLHLGENVVIVIYPKCDIFRWPL